MSKKSKTLKKEHTKIEQQIDNVNISIKKVIIIIISIILVLGLFYLLTIGILSKKDKKTNSRNTSIQYTEILAGESFTQKDKEYLVFFYDTSKDDMENNHTILSNYKDKKNSLKVYTVDMHEGLNKNYRSDNEDNLNPKAASELKISKSTIIHIKDGKVIDYVNNDLSSYLNNL